jgi:acetolactate synthase-1/3 small subunit
MPDHPASFAPLPATAPDRCQLLVDIGSEPAAAAVIELRVRNHPGTMSHITGLFARRGFNLEAIACAPVGDGRESRMLLLLADEPRLDQVERQLAKLYDVLAVRHRPDVSAAFFQNLFPPGDGGSAVA